VRYWEGEKGKTEEGGWRVLVSRRPRTLSRDILSNSTGGVLTYLEETRGEKELKGGRGNFESVVGRPVIVHQGRLPRLTMIPSSEADAFQGDQKGREEEGVAGKGGGFWMGRGTWKRHPHKEASSLQEQTRETASSEETAGNSEQEMRAKIKPPTQTRKSEGSLYLFPVVLKLLECGGEEEFRKIKDAGREGSSSFRALVLPGWWVGVGR